jgi:hypothetical protein
MSLGGIRGFGRGAHHPALCPSVGARLTRGKERTPPAAVKNRIRKARLLQQRFEIGPEILGINTSGDAVATVGEPSTNATAKNVAIDPLTHAVWATYSDGKSSFAKSWLPK